MVLSCNLFRSVLYIMFYSMFLFLFNVPVRLQPPLSLLHLSVFLRYCVADLFGDPLLRPIQHSDCIQQAWAKLPQASAGCRGLLAVLLVLDSAPSVGLEQLWHRGGRNKLLRVLDGSDSPVACLHHLPLHFLSGYTCPGDDLLLWQAVMGSQTGRETSLCVCEHVFMPFACLMLKAKPQIA